MGSSFPAVCTIISASTIDLAGSIGSYVDTRSWQVASTVKVTIIYLRKPSSPYPHQDQSSHPSCLNPTFGVNPLGTSIDVSLLSWAQTQLNPRYRIVSAVPLNSTTIGDIKNISREHYHAYTIMPLAVPRSLGTPHQISEISPFLPSLVVYASYSGGEWGAVRINLLIVDSLISRQCFLRGLLRGLWVTWCHDVKYNRALTRQEF